MGERGIKEEGAGVAHLRRTQIWIAGTRKAATWARSKHGCSLHTPRHHPLSLSLSVSASRSRRKKKCAGSKRWAGKIEEAETRHQHANLM
jgi:hypothetical protein